jgi:hypothetical protein
MDAALREEIDGLAALGTPALKAKYVEAFGERSRSGNAAFLRKRIAWRLQARAMGGLSERARRRAKELADEADVRVRAPSPSQQRRSSGAPRDGSADASRRRRDPRLPPVGELLVREFRGMPVAVRVLEDGFEYQGRRYASLSTIACEAAGTRWNGYRFFELA